MFEGHPFFSLVEAGATSLPAYFDDPENHPDIVTALRIRAVENALYALFGQGKLHGTIHTCVGQEFGGVLLARALAAGDFVTSNHRCHGHFIAATGKWQGLVDEIVGNVDGVCAGIGSSQHLWAENFLSNGPQAALLPVAAGIALDRKHRHSGSIVLSFIGEGTLGEGVLYETLNLDSLWGLPHLIVCENNLYSQSTPQSVAVAGSIAQRAEAFGIRVFEANTWDLAELKRIAAGAAAVVREGVQPAFLVLKTYRLNPHSKGDDQRDQDEIRWFEKADPLNTVLRESERYRRVYADIVDEVDRCVALALAKPALEPSAYFGSLDVDPEDASGWRPVKAANSGDRVVQELNRFYESWLGADEKFFMLGEDIHDPYGGAFKVTRGLSTSFPDRVLTTPISEAAITGAGIGLALSGNRAAVEIMFGDFITYAFDQIVSNASKLFHMYNRHVACPVVIRTPMGGRRGYGPTHSQSLERLLIGIDHCRVLSLNSLAPVSEQIAAVRASRQPVLLLENKIDYTLRVLKPPSGFVVETNGARFPTLRVHPEAVQPTLTIVSYGGMARYVADRLLELFQETDAIPELIVPTSLYPLDIAPIAAAVATTGALLLVEEGASFGGVGGELIAQLSEGTATPFRAKRLGAEPVPIPSAPSLEETSLPGFTQICSAIDQMMTGGS